jgi:CBS domain-containing protein
MTEAPARELSGPTPPPAPVVADVMRPAVTTVEQNAHLAGAAYLMKRAGATAIVVLDDDQSRRPIGLITEADVVQAVADGKDVNDVRIRHVMTDSPTGCQGTTSIRDAAESMMAGRFRHLPVVNEAGLVGIVDIAGLCRALLDRSTGAGEEP